MRVHSFPVVRLSKLDIMSTPTHRAEAIFVAIKHLDIIAKAYNLPGNPEEFRILSGQQFGSRNGKWFKLESPKGGSLAYVLFGRPDRIVTRSEMGFQKL
jgi:hypothetical protein